MVDAFAAVRGAAPAYLGKFDPQVTVVSPSMGPASGGTTVTLTGFGFDQNPGQTNVVFGTVAAANVSCISGSSCTATSPPGTVGTDVIVAVSVNGEAGPVNQDAHFTYTSGPGVPPPSVNAIAPTNGPSAGGTWVTVSGSRFDTSGGTVIKFGSTSAVTSSCSSTSQCSALSPGGSGVVDITATVGGQTSATGSADQFTYLGGGTLTVNQVLPNSGPAYGGNTVQVQGSGFVNFQTSFYFGGVLADPGKVSCNGQQCSVVVPPNTSGRIADIQAAVGSQTSPPVIQDQYHYDVGPSILINSMTPASGPADGSQPVTINAYGISPSPGVSAVSFGQGAGTITSCNYVNVPANSVSCFVQPPAGTGSVGVNVFAANQSAYAGAYSYGPTISTLSQARGPASGGVAMTITGTSFAPGTNQMIVKAGTVAASDVNCASSTSCTFTLPAATIAGQVYITASAGSLTPLTPYDRFTYLPTVAGLSAATGTGGSGTAVTITGSGFDTTPGATTITFGGVLATGVSCSSSTSCTATSPAGAGSIDVTATVSQSVSPANVADLFSYVPQVSSLSQGAGPGAGGTALTITGSGFDTTPGRTSLYFGPYAAANISCSSTSQCSATSPQGKGTVHVAAIVSAQTSPQVGGDQFVYNAPSVSGVTPSSGPAPGGTVVSITGTGFSTTAGATTVKFGANPATNVSCGSSTSCQATSPAGTGTVDVRVTVTGLTSPAVAADQFTYQPPTVTSVSPASGPVSGGTVVTITGSGFNATAGATSVKFGSTAATGVTCTSTTSCTATSPAGSGTVDVSVTANGQTSVATAADKFSYAVAVTSPAPSSTLQSANVSFSWPAGPTDTAYLLQVGVAPGGNQYYAGTSTTNLTAFVPGLPVNGATVYARLWSFDSSVSSWLYADTSYTAAPAVAGASLVTSPVPGTPLPGASTSFSWTASAGNSYFFSLGSTVGGSDYYTSGSITSTSVTVNGLPTDGRLIYLRLLSNLGGQYASVDYRYVAAGAGVNTPGPAVLVSPATGSGASTTPTLSWSAPASGTLAGTTTYTVRLFQGSAPTAATTGTAQPATTSTSYTVPSSAGLGAGQTWWWIVVACNGATCTQGGSYNGPLGAWQKLTP